MYQWLWIPLHYILSQVSAILLNGKQGDCWLWRWGPGSNVQWRVWVMGVKSRVRTLFKGVLKRWEVHAETVSRLLVFQGPGHMPVAQRSGKETRRICVRHRMWVFQLFRWAVFPKPCNVFGWITSVPSKTTRCLDGCTASSTHYQCNLGKAI